MCHHYGPNEFFDAYYADLALEVEVRGNRQPIEERAEYIVLPRLLSAFAGVAVFVCSLVILVDVVG